MQAPNNNLSNTMLAMETSYNAPTEAQSILSSPEAFEAYKQDPKSYNLCMKAQMGAQLAIGQAHMRKAFENANPGIMMQTFPTLWARVSFIQHSL